MNNYEKLLKIHILLSCYYPNFQKYGNISNISHRKLSSFFTVLSSKIKTVVVIPLKSKNHQYLNDNYFIVCFFFI